MFQVCFALYIAYIGMKLYDTWTNMLLRVKEYKRREIS